MPKRHATVAGGRAPTVKSRRPGRHFRPSASNDPNARSATLRGVDAETSEHIYALTNDVRRLDQLVTSGLDRGMQRWAVPGSNRGPLACKDARRTRVRAESRDAMPGAIVVSVYRVEDPCSSPSVFSRRRWRFIRREIEEWLLAS